MGRRGKGPGIKVRWDRWQPHSPPDETPPACYFCRRAAELCKGGRSICRACSGKVRGREFPLRKLGERDISPSREFSLAYQLAMVEDDAT